MIHAREFFAFNVGGMSVIEKDIKKQIIILANIAFRMKMLPEDAAMMLRELSDTCKNGLNSGLSGFKNDPEFLKYLNEFMKSRSLYE